MKTEMLISTGILAALFFLAIGATEANTFVVQVLCTGSAVALGFYHLHRGSIGFSIEQALAQKSILLGVVAAMPVANYLAS